MTKIHIKNKRKEAIKNESFLFRLLILLGAVRYKISYDRFHGYRKTYKVRAWHPFTWIMTVLIVTLSIPKIIFDTFKGLFKDLKDEFKEQTYYC